jgi:hypothetical protein
VGSTERMKRHETERARVNTEERQLYKAMLTSERTRECVPNRPTHQKKLLQRPTSLEIPR